jgi:hypothetical protein
MRTLYEKSCCNPFDGYAYVNGQRSGGGEYGTIPISGFTTVGFGQVRT